MPRIDHLPLRQRRLSAALVVLSLAAAACSEDVLRPPPEVTDEFAQNVAARVDILWVVDNSISMAQEQAALGEAFNNFIQRLSASAVDYHVGVVTTDPVQGGVLRTGQSNKQVFDGQAAAWPFTGTPGSETFLSPLSSNVQQTFAEMVTVGVWGALQERGLETATMALGIGPSWDGLSAANPPPQNAGFLRADAALFVVAVSDEDDESFGPVSYYYRALESYRGRGMDGRVTFSAIVGPAPDPMDPADDGGCNQADRGSASWGSRYIQLASLTGGVATSICEDFNENLATLSYAAAGLSQKFGPLSRGYNPAAKTPCGDAYADQPFCVMLRLDGQAAGSETPVPHGRPDGWELIEEQEGQTTKAYIFFYGQSVPPPRATVLVSYRAGAVALGT